ncbi:DUF7059 domain-containing protein [Georgenia faecalis]|uniref:DUF7059 domain-containing protein n=1 Tax=Georgenia faecalis TaxID=2483799 RepID=UPI000FD86CEE|nr:methyltransferase [Georgenia faecalis]
MTASFGSAPAGGSAPAPRSDDAALLAAARTDLGAYTVDEVTGLLGPVADAALHREQRVPALRAARASAAPVAAVVRTFLLGDTVRRRELDAALPTLATAGAERLGLVGAAGADGEDEVRARCDLRPYAATDAGGEATWWVASDLGEAATGAPLAADHVLGIGGASLTLAQVTVRTPRRRALDLGTGCGIQALHAARHCADVVATDLSARALAFAAFNAALAGVGLDLREGSLLEPVAGDRFDLVVSNPPFVITPPAARAAGLPAMEYRDGGRGGDDLVRDLVVGVGEHLAPGGVAQLLGNWEHRVGEDWRERVGAWLADSGLDGWVVQRELLDPAEYVETWLRDGGLRAGADRGRYEAAYDAWIGDFEARGVEGVGFGYLTLRRPTATRTPWHRLESITGDVRQPLGGHVAAVLAAQDWLADRDDAALLGSTLAVAPDVTEERYLRPGALDPEVILLRQGGGLGRTVQAGTALAAVVGACDGDLTLGQIVGAVAALLEAPTDAVVGEIVPQVRGLVLDGLLAPTPS